MPLSLPPMLSSARGRKHAAGNLSLNARPLVAHIPGVVMVFAISIIILLGSSTPAEGTPLSFNNKYGPEMSFSSFPQQFDAKRVFVGRQLIPGQSPMLQMYPFVVEPTYGTYPYHQQWSQRMIPFADRERNFPKKAAATRLIPDTIVDPTTKEEGKVAAKRTYEYIRFGKRSVGVPEKRPYEYIRFGKRLHPMDNHEKKATKMAYDYIRFG